MFCVPSISGLFKWRQFEPEVILLAVGWYLRFSLSYRDYLSMPASRARRRTMYHASTRDMDRSGSLPVLPMAARVLVADIDSKKLNEAPRRPAPLPCQSVPAAFGAEE
jgi:hypothetical protein